MSITLHIPDSVTRGMRIPEGEMEPRLKVELAVALYSQGILSFGKAGELAEIGRQQLAELLGQRGIERHYGKEEWGEDTAYARGE